VKLDIHAGYALMVLLGLVLVLRSAPTKHFPSEADRRAYYRMQIITVIGALLGAKIAVIFGDALWPLQPFHDWSGLLLSGRSIAGALLLGFVAAEVAKPLMGYKLPPNDRFAAILPFSLGIGRIGCLIAGCCRGVPYDGPFAITYADGIPRHPAPVYEMVFDIAMGFVLLALMRRGLLFGRLFALYLVAYGVFRFFSEFLRETAKPFAGLSAYQWMAIAMVVAGLIAMLARSREEPPEWKAFRERAESAA